MKTKHEKIVEVLAENSYYSKDHIHELRAEDFDEVATTIEQLEPEGEKAEAFLNRKVKDCNGGYDDFAHYCDCRELEPMVFEIFRWMEEYTPQQPSEGEIKELWLRYRYHLVHTDAMDEAGFKAAIKELLNQKR